VAFSNGPRTQQANEPGTKPSARQRLYDSGTGGQPYEVLFNYPWSRLYKYGTKLVGHRFHARLQGHYSYLCKADRRQAPLAVFRIRVHLTRILVHLARIRVQHFKLNTDPDPGF
jgi:hypothetical protein